MARPPAPWTLGLGTDPGSVAPTQAAILDGLRAAILQGVAPPGTPIHVDDVAARFGVSRIPVREALKTLVGEGLVEHEPRGGYLVAHLTVDELVELYVVRAALETAALSAAVRRAGRADDVEVAESYDALSAAIEGGDVRAHHRDSRRFHLALASPCAMPRLLRMFESAWNLTEPVQPMSHIAAPHTVALHDDHRVMVDAFLARDHDALLECSQLHYRRLEELVSHLPSGLFQPRRRPG